MDPSFWPLPSAPSPSGFSVSFRGCCNPFQPYLVHDTLWSLIVGYVWVCQFDSHVAMMQRISVVLWGCMSLNQASLIKSLRNIFGYPHLNKKPSPLGPLSIFFMASSPFGQANRFPFESLWHVSGCPKSGKNWTANRQGTAEASHGQGNQHSRDLALICRWLSTQNSLEIDAASAQNCVNKYTSPLGRSSMEDSSHKIEVKTTSTNWGSEWKSPIGTGFSGTMWPCCCSTNITSSPRTPWLAT